MDSPIGSLPAILFRTFRLSVPSILCEPATPTTGPFKKDWVAPEQVLELQFRWIKTKLGRLKTD